MCELKIYKSPWKAVLTHPGNHCIWANVAKELETGIKRMIVPNCNFRSINSYFTLNCSKIVYLLSFQNGDFLKFRFQKETRKFPQKHFEKHHFLKKPWWRKDTASESPAEEIKNFLGNGNVIRGLTIGSPGRSNDLSPEEENKIMKA